MHTRKDRIAALLCTLALLGMFTTAQAAEWPTIGNPDIRTVHATVWDGWKIYMEGIDVRLVDEHETFYHPFAYDGTVYIPLQTASEWTGGSCTWNANTATATITGTGEPYYRDQYRDQTEAERVRSLQDMEQGADMDLRPDIKIYWNDELYPLTDAAGNTLCPAVIHGSVFIPIRGAAHMAGLEIIYLPPQENSPGVQSGQLSEFSLILDPELKHHTLAKIMLYRKPTQEQVNAAQAYLDAARSLLYDGAVADMMEFLSFEDMDNETLVEWLHRFEHYTIDFWALQKPDAPFMDRTCRAIRSHAGDIQFYGTTSRLGMASYANSVNCPDLHPTYAGVKHGATTITQAFGWLRFDMDDGQRILDAVRTQMVQQAGDST